MQSLWSRVAASQSTCRCVSCLSTTANGVTSRSAAAASKRRLRIGNSVTALYTSIFAAAALADARSKTQRRHDWEEKIAAVKAETNELVDEEQRIIESLQTREGNGRLDRLLHERGFGNATNFTPVMRRRPIPNQPTRSFHTERQNHNSATAIAFESNPIEDDIDTKAYEEDDFDLGTATNEPSPSWVLDEPLRLKAIQKLALKQYAIRLLLRPTIAQRYSGLPRNYPTDFEVPQINIPNLLDELNNLRLRITDIQTNADAKYEDVVQDITAMNPAEARSKGASLDAELSQDLQLFMNKKMSVQEVILRVSSNLISSVDPDRTSAFRNMLITFTRSRQNDLNELLLRTLLPHKFYLSTPLINTILSFYRKSKNLKDFDLFLQMLSGDGYGVNLGRMGYYECRSFNGVNVVVPPLDSNSTVIYTELISCALRFDQPDRADAWLQAARKVGFFDNFTTLFSYIRFCSIRQDWEKGISALRRAVTYLVSSTNLPTELVKRLVVLMAHLCDSCNQKSVSEALISAAMKSGFDPRLPSEQMDVAPITDPAFERWTKAAQTAPAENVDRPLWQKCSDFAHDFGAQLTQFELSANDSRQRQLANFAARHAQNAMLSALSHERPRSQKPNTREQLSSSLQSENDTSNIITPPAESTSREVSALKEEVAQLRELVFEIRKHHIQASFKPSSNHSLQLFGEEPAPRTVKSTVGSRQTPQPVNVEFERTSIRGVKSMSSPSSSLSQNTKQKASNSRFARILGGAQRRPPASQAEVRDSSDPASVSAQQ